LFNIWVYQATNCDALQIS